MLKFSLFTLTFFILGTSASPIMNGYFVKNQKNFPYMVLLEVFEETQVGYCGGVLVRRDAVLTAAHCLISCKNKFDIRATVGILDTERDEGQAIRSSGYKIHEDFGGIDPKDPKFAHHDIGFVWLRRKFDLDENVQLAALPEKPVKMLNSVGVAIGWGRTQDNKRSDLLKGANLRVISINKCTEYFTPDSFTGKSFCVKSDNERDSTCEGDSGGPFIYGGIVRGILSFSGNIINFENGKRNVQCVPKYPQVFSDVSLYYDWIEDNLQRRENDAKKPPQNVPAVCRNSPLINREKINPQKSKHKTTPKSNRRVHKRPGAK